MRSSHCHCRQCQKGHGAPFRTRVRVAAAYFRFLARRVACLVLTSRRRVRGFCKCAARGCWRNSWNTRAAYRPTPAPWRFRASRRLRSTTTPASAPTRTRLSSTRRRGSRSPKTFPNTQRVSPARTHHTIPDRPIAGIARVAEGVQVTKKHEDSSRRRTERPPTFQ
jgi:hypothetical protein